MKGTLKLYYGNDVIDTMPYADEADREAVIQYWKTIFELPEIDLEVKDITESLNQ